MYKIQMPISEEIKTLVEEKGNQFGLKNVNDVIRFLMTNFAQDRIKIILDPNTNTNDIISPVNPIKKENAIEKLILEKDDNFDNVEVKNS